MDGKGKKPFEYNETKGFIIEDSTEKSYIEPESAV